MPKGIYDRTGKTSKDEIKNFVKFCFREDVAEKLKGIKLAHKLAVELYFNETGKKIKPQTAYQQRNKWVIVDGNVYRKE